MAVAQCRARQGVRWQSAAATPLSHAPAVNEPFLILVRTKARVPNILGIPAAVQNLAEMGGRHFETGLQFYLNRSSPLCWK